MFHRNVTYSLPREEGCKLKKSCPAHAFPHWGCCLKAPRWLWPFGQKKRKSTSDDEIGRRLADTRSISLTRRVTVPGSAGAGTGDSGGMPLTLPTCLHHRVVQEPEPMEAEPEAALSEEPEPAPPASTAPEAGMLPAGTSAGDQEPAGDWAPAHSEADSVREELVSAPVPGPAFAMDPAPDNTCASALESAPASPPTPPPVERPEPLLVPTALLLEQLPFVLSPKPGNLQERFVPDVPGEKVKIRRSMQVPWREGGLGNSEQHLSRAAGAATPSRARPGTHPGPLWRGLSRMYLRECSAQWWGKDREWNSANALGDGGILGPSPYGRMSCSYCPRVIGGTRSRKHLLEPPPATLLLGTFGVVEEVERIQGDKGPRRRKHSTERTDGRAQCHHPGPGL
ncbi:translation initiation factor IF-2-like [Mustela erminea]|uniref:translation initiation factor IF-2-like n=1 Tax=Mustela erminea TaxID=36723 RepID=UPI00138680EC|nr:translation initiation factor IF-2-like [Mustela erminea]